MATLARLSAAGAYLHSPWFLASSWYGEYYTRWQDYVGGKTLVTTNLTMLDKLRDSAVPG